MDKKRSIAVLMMVVTTLNLGSISAHFPPETCVRSCVTECELSGIDAAVCIRYCPVHCLPQDTSARGRYCNLKCMLDSCAQFTNDDENMTDCISKCNRSQCRFDSDVSRAGP